MRKDKFTSTGEGRLISTVDRSLRYVRAEQ